MENKVTVKMSERIGEIEYKYEVEYGFGGKTPCFTTLEYLPDILEKVKSGEEEC